MFGGGVGRFIAAAVGGLAVETGPLADPAGAGWRTLLVHPSPHAMRTLGRAGTSRRTPQGEASVSWRAGGGVAGEAVAELALVVPPAARADVRLPLLLDRAAPRLQGGEGPLGDRRVTAGGCAMQCAAAR
jgi:hypothetical protein